MATGLNDTRPGQRHASGSGSSPRLLRRVLREPLPWFLLAGLALFLTYGWLRPEAFTRSEANRIVLTDDDMRQMSVQWMAQGRPPPSADQWRSLIATKVREEILYREALGLGLDRDDAIVKRRMAQKMEFLAEDVGSLAEPSPADLRTWFASNATRFSLPARASFRHIYFSPDKRGPKTRSDAERVLNRLASQPAATAVASEAGDAFMFQDYYGDRSSEQVAAQFGPQFARALFEQPAGRWTGPIESGYGWHVVFVESITPGRTPAFDEIAADVKLGWLAERREEVRQRMFNEMRSRYEVVLPTAASALSDSSPGTARPKAP